MARPTKISDERILDTAERILAREGVGGFSLAAVARDIGITRAAITFRFHSSGQLKTRAAQRGVDRFAAEMRELELVRGGDGLLAIATYIGARFKSQSSLSHFLAQSHARLQDPDLVMLERKRGDAMRETIDRAMPLSVPNRADTIAVFSAHLTGTLHAWTAIGVPSAPEYLRARSAMLLKAIGISYSKVAGAQAATDLLQES